MQAGAHCKAVLRPPSCNAGVRFDRHHEALTQAVPSGCCPPPTSPASPSNRAPKAAPRSPAFVLPSFFAPALPLLPPLRFFAFFLLLPPPLKRVRPALPVLSAACCDGSLTPPPPLPADDPPPFNPVPLVGLLASALLPVGAADAGPSAAACCDAACSKLWARFDSRDSNSESPVRHAGTCNR